MEFAANLDGSEIRNDPVKGRVYARVAWGKTNDGVILAPPAKHWQPPPVVKA